MKKLLDATPILIALFLLALVGHMDYDAAVEMEIVISNTVTK